mmetsp:Transcript_31397/g.97151  ORF Transcript_31397/g.97151 Transcript_31397/m.97151 type:complete len:223 (+) Transcript_31397:400-1068(+)
MFARAASIRRRSDDASCRRGYRRTRRGNVAVPPQLQRGSWPRSEDGSRARASSKRARRRAKGRVAKPQPRPQRHRTIVTGSDASPRPQRRLAGGRRSTTATRVDEIGASATPLHHHQRDDPRPHRRRGRRHHLVRDGARPLQRSVAADVRAVAAQRGQVRRARGRRRERDGRGEQSSRRRRLRVCGGRGVAGPGGGGAVRPLVPAGPARGVAHGRRQGRDRS